MGAAFDKWKAELLHSGAIVQDDDPSVGSDEAEQRFLRYVEMVDAVTGEEGRPVFDALLASATAKHDYGAYQATIGAIFRFPPELRGTWLLENLPWFDDINSEFAGDLLSGMANEGPSAPSVVAFQQAWSDADPTTAAAIRRIIDREEELPEGWLSEKPFRLRPGGSIPASKHQC